MAVVVVVVVVVRGRLAEEGLDAAVPAVVEHDDLDDLLTLDERLGPKVGHADGGLVLLLEVEVVGRGCLLLPAAAGAEVEAPAPGLAPAGKVAPPGG